MLYRCLISGAAVSGQLRERLYQHIVDSHFHMAKAFSNGGVFPVAILMPDGVRHSYVYYKKRPTLHEALQPLRLLANEILLSPTEEYANCVVKRLDEMGQGTPSISNTATALCLAVPIAKLRPKEVRAILEPAKEISNGLFINMAEETLQVMNQQKLQ